MGMSGATVLVVDNQPAVAEAYQSYLMESYDVRLAFDGETALEKLDDSVDVVLLDRRMPALSGDEVLSHIRARGHECQVAMVTSTKPDVDVIDMGFDEYLMKPVSEDTLLSTVEGLLDRRDYDETLQEYYTSAKKYAALKAERSAEALEDTEEFKRLRRRVRRLGGDVEQAFDRIETREGVDVAVDRSSAHPSHRS